MHLVLIINSFLSVFLISLTSWLIGHSLLNILYTKKELERNLLNNTIKYFAGISWIIIAISFSFILSQNLVLNTTKYIFVFAPLFLFLIKNKFKSLNMNKNDLKSYLKILISSYIPLIIICLAGILQKDFIKVQFGVDASMYMGVTDHFSSYDYPLFDENIINAGPTVASGINLHQRWGIGLLNSFFSSKLIPNYYSNFISICSSFTGVTSLFMLTLVKDIKKINKSIVNIIFLILITNSFVYFLILETQWPNLISICLFFVSNIFLIKNIWSDEISSKNFEKSKAIRKKNIILASIFSAAGGCIYGEFIFINLFFTFCIIGINFLLFMKSDLYKGKNDFFKLTKFFLKKSLLYFSSFFIFISPYLLRSYTHMSTLQTSRVGYTQPTPITIFDLIGLSSSWNYFAWRTPVSSVDSLVDSNYITEFIFLSFIGLTIFILISINFLEINITNIKDDKYRIFIVSSIILPIYSFFAFFYIFINRTNTFLIKDYIWLKFLSYNLFFCLLLFIFIITKLSYIKNTTFLNISSKLKTDTKFILPLFILINIILNLGIYLYQYNFFSSKARVIDKKTWAQISSKHPECMILLSPRGANSSITRYADRTRDFVIVSLADNKVRILDSWNSSISNFEGTGYAARYSGRICLLLDTRKNSEIPRYNLNNKNYLQLDNDWLLVTTDLTYEEIKKRGSESIYSEIYRENPFSSGKKY